MRTAEHPWRVCISRCGSVGKLSLSETLERRLQPPAREQGRLGRGLSEPRTRTGFYTKRKVTSVARATEDFPGSALRRLFM